MEHRREKGDYPAHTDWGLIWGHLPLFWRMPTGITGKAT